MRDTNTMHNPRPHRIPARKPYWLPLPLLLLTLAGCGEPLPQASAQPSAQPAAAQPTAAAHPKSDLGKRIQWADASPAPLATLVTLTAEVVLPPRARYVLSPPMSGRLTQWHIEPGQWLDLGQPLADLRSPELATLQSQESQYKQVVDRYRKLLEDQRAFVRDGVQTIQSLYDAEAAYAEARAQLSAIQSQRQAARALVIPAADGISWTWTAEVQGQVSEISCPLGTVPAAQTPCLTVLDTHQSILRTHLPERHLALLAAQGTALTARWSPTSAPDDAPPIPMTLIRTDPALDTASRTLALYYSPNNSPDNKTPANAALMRPGTTGRVTLSVPNADAATSVLVPKLCVTQIDNQPHVFINPDDPKPLPVKVLGRSEDGLIVSSPALKVGDKVAAQGVFLLKSIAIIDAEEASDEAP